MPDQSVLHRHPQMSFDPPSGDPSLPPEHAGSGYAAHPQQPKHGLGAASRPVHPFDDDRVFIGALLRQAGPLYGVDQTVKGSHSSSPSIATSIVPRSSSSLARRP